MRILFPLATVLTCFIGVVPGWCATPPTPVRLAVVAADGSQETVALVDLLTVCLPSDQLELVERSDFDRVLREQGLSAAGLAYGGANRVSVGQALRAEGFLFIGRLQSGNRFSVRLAETRYGFQVCQMLYQTEGAKTVDLASKIAVAIRPMLNRLRMKDKDRVLVSVIRFGNVTMDPRANWIEEQAPLLLAACLSAHPRILILERQNLGTLVGESLLTAGSEASPSKAAVLMDGDVFLAGDQLTGEEKQVSLCLRLRDSTLKELSRFEKRGSLKTLEQMVADAASDAMKYLSILRPGEENSANAESTELLRVAKMNGVGFWAVEAAHALDETDTEARKRLITGLIQRGNDSSGKESAAYFARATDMILSSTNPSVMPTLVHINYIHGVLADIRSREDPEIREMLRPVRSLARVQMDANLLVNEKHLYFAVNKANCFFDNAHDQQTYLLSLFDRIAADKNVSSAARKARSAILLSQTIFPPPVYDSYCNTSEPFINFIAHVKAGRLASSQVERTKHYEAAIALLHDTLIEAKAIARLSTLHLDTSPSSHYTDFFFTAVMTLHAAGAKYAKGVSEEIGVCFSTLAKSGDLASLADMQADDYFGLLDPAVVLNILDDVAVVRRESTARLPSSEYGKAALDRFVTIRYELAKKSRPWQAPETGSKLVLLSPQMRTWQETVGTVYQEDCDWWDLALIPQRLLVEDRTLWIALGGMLRKRENNSDISTMQPIAKFALLKMDLSTGRILSYRVGKYKPPKLRGQRHVFLWNVSSICRWENLIVVAERDVGVYLFSQEDVNGTHTLNEARLLTEKDGLPSLDVITVAGIGSDLFIGLPTALVRWNRNAGGITVVAQTQGESLSGPLAHVGNVMALAADEATSRLYAATAKGGVWCLSLKSNTWFQATEFPSHLGNLNRSIVVCSTRYSDGTISREPNSGEQPNKDWKLVYTTGQEGVTSNGLSWVLQNSISPPVSTKKADLGAAVRAGNREEATRLLAAGANANQPDTGGSTPLALAIAAGREDLALLLLQHGADFRIMDPTCGTPLTCAASHGMTNVVRELLNRGEAIDRLAYTTDTSPFTALMAACSHGQAGIARLLLDHKANAIRPAGCGGRPMVSAAFGGDVEILRMLQNVGAGIDIPDDNDFTPLMVAARQGRLAAVNWLLQAGANCNRRSKESAPVLLYGMMSGDPGVVRALLEAGADPYERLKEEEGGIIVSDFHCNQEVNAFLDVALVPRPANLQVKAR